MLLYKKSHIRDKRLYLTFDDGPNPHATPAILDILDKFRVKAAFFIVGRNIVGFPKIVKEIYKRGHIIGNHSFSHSALFSLYDPEKQKTEAKKIENLLADIGVSSCSYFRPPNALCTKKMMLALHNYKIVGTNHYVLDNLLFSSHAIASMIILSIKSRGGGILVLHDGTHDLFAFARKVIPKALNIMIPKLLSQGYKFSSLDKIVNSNVLILPNSF